MDWNKEQFPDLVSSVWMYSHSPGVHPPAAPLPHFHLSTQMDRVEGLSGSHWEGSSRELGWEEKKKDSSKGALRRFSSGERDSLPTI